MFQGRTYYLRRKTNIYLTVEIIANIGRKFYVPRKNLLPKKEDKYILNG